jgi:hypothetical protein
MQIVMGIFTLLMLKAYHSYYTTHNRIMSPHLFMILSFMMFLASTVCEHIHWHDYFDTGEGHYYLDMAGQSFRNVAEVLMTCVFLMIANGWTLTYQVIDWRSNSDMYIPIAIVLCIFQVLVGCFDYLDLDHSHKYHDFAGWQGFLMIGTKLAVTAFFAY